MARSGDSSDDENLKDEILSLFAKLMSGKTTYPVLLPLDGFLLIFTQPLTPVLRVLPFQKDERKTSDGYLGKKSM